MKITQAQIDLIKLIGRTRLRHPGEDWSVVTASGLCNFFIKNQEKDLYEFEMLENGSGRVRLTNEGEVILKWL